MAESISIPLRHIQYLLDEIAPSWVYNRLQKLMSMLIQIQQGEDCKLLQVTTDGFTYSKKFSDIRYFAYHIDDQLDTIYINIESCGRWARSGIPRAIKMLAIAYHKRRVLHNIRSLTDLVQKSEFVRSQNSDIRQWNEEQRLCPNHHHDDNKFSYDFEGRISMLDNFFLRIVTILTDKNRYETIIYVNLVYNYVYVKAIYENISIRKYFQSVVWVCVAENLKRKLVYCSILKQLLSNDKKNDVVGLMSMKEDELWKELMEVLTSYKCLILLAFDREKYDQSLVDQFNVPMRSRLLVIENSNFDWFHKYEWMKVPKVHMHQYEWMNVEEDHRHKYGWRLLESMTIQNHEKEVPNFSQLKKIGLALIDIFNSVPRQIIRIGGLLRENISLSHWEMVQRSLNNISIDTNYVWMTLALCYDNLSIHLKACFLYFGQFWEGDDISTEMLYQMWLAEGLVSSHLLVGEGRTTMDIADEYLAMFARMLLIDVQVSEFSTARRFVSCRIDNIVKNFCLQPEEQFFYQTSIIRVEKTTYGFKYSIRDGSRLSIKFYVSIHKHDQDAIDIQVIRALNLASKELRSLLIQKESGIPRIKITFPTEMICKKFKLLRVLKIENLEIRGGKLPKDIRTLVHLRFLSLEGSTFEEFPKTLGNFRFMQTLDLRVAEIIPRGIVVPNVLWKIKELRYLYLPTCHRLPEGKSNKLSLNGLDKLETLVNFDVEKVELTSLEWKSLKHIDVTVHGKKTICDVIDCINKSGDKLKETFLHVKFSDFSYEESDVPLEVVFNCSKLNHFTVNWGRCDLNEFKIPSDPFSSNLIELRLIRCQIREDPMPILGNFPQLRKLVLGKKTFMGKCMTFESQSFPTLRYLKIKDLKYLEELKIWSESMRDLSCLKIICCLRLKMIPIGLKFLKSLTELKFRMPKIFNDKIRTRDEDKGVDVEKVEYVRFIFLEDW